MSIETIITNKTGIPQKGRAQLYFDGATQSWKSKTSSGNSTPITGTLSEPTAVDVVDKDYTWVPDQKVKAINLKSGQWINGPFFTVDSDYAPVIPEENTLQTLYPEVYGTPGSSFYGRIFRGLDGNLWLQTPRNTGLTAANYRTLIRLHEDYSPDYDNSPPPFYSAQYQSFGNIEVDANGKLMIPYTGATFYDGTPSPQKLTRYNLDMTQDESFVFVANANVYAILPLDGGDYLVAGDFATVNGVNKAKLAVVDSEGTVDETFDPGTGPNMAVRLISKAQPGSFWIYDTTLTSYDGNTVKPLIMIDMTGGLDSSFDLPTLMPGLTNSYLSCSFQPDGSVLLYGATVVNPEDTDKTRLVKINPDGTFDPVVGFYAGVEVVSNENSFPIKYIGELSNGDIVFFSTASTSGIPHVSELYRKINGVPVSACYVMDHACETLVADLDWYHNAASGNSAVILNFVPDEVGGWSCVVSSLVFIGSLNVTIHVDMDSMPDGTRYFLDIFTGDPLHTFNLFGYTPPSAGPNTTPNRHTIVEIMRIGGYYRWVYLASGLSY